MIIYLAIGLGYLRNSESVQVCLTFKNDFGTLAASPIAAVEKKGPNFSPEFTLSVGIYISASTTFAKFLITISA